jgi:MFS transporter, SHS family, lactate transporter
MGMPSVASPEDRSNQRNVLLAGFLGWTLDAFDFFILVMVLPAVAKDLAGGSIPKIALTITASLAMRPVGAFIFGLMADRYGRRLPLMLDIVFYSVIEVFSGLAPNYTVFLALRLLYGIGMGGEWGVGASLTMESVAPRWRGVFSGLLQQGYAVGYMIAALVAYFVYPHWGWRPMFFIGGLPALLSLFIRAKVKESAAWQRSRTDWATYRRMIVRNWKLFLYIIVMMMMMSSMAHGTQDMYPTFLKHQRGYSAEKTSVIVMISMVGAILGGFVFGLLSDRKGRRRAMIMASLSAALLIPLWLFAPSTGVMIVGAFLMQFMVQGAWGVVPAHLNELSPDAIRGFFPAFAYQLGVLCASSTTYLQARFAQHFSYSTVMGVSMAVVLVVGAVVIGLGPERCGLTFGEESAQTAVR